MKKNKFQKQFLDELRKVPIVQVACEKTGLSRNSVYRWRNEDADFRKAMEEAIAEGEELVNDMSEGQLLTLIKEKNYSAISFWLRKRNPKFKDRLEVEVAPKQEELTEEQEETVREALRLASMDPITSHITKTNHGTEPATDAPDGNDAEGPEGTNGDH
jgi:hypothetical protein